MQALSADWMNKAEALCMERLATELGRELAQRGVGRRRGIKDVGEQRRSRALGEMHPDLMRPPRLQAALDPRGRPIRQRLQHADVRHRTLTRFEARREAQTRARMPPVQRFDATLPRYTDGERLIHARDAVLGELAFQIL